jgi:glucokinase
VGTRLILALDIGGTKLSAATLEPGGNAWRDHRRLISMPRKDADNDLQTIITLANEILNGETPNCVGVSFGGPVDYISGTVRLSHHVPGWENVLLKTILENEINATVQVDNDANVAALGEHRYGAGKGFANICYLTVSTGVGAGWILNGEPWRGSDGMAGEIGHTVVDLDGPRCLCGKRGCVERLASGPYMAADARAELPSEGTQPGQGGVLRSIVGSDPEKITAKTLALAAAQGDEFAWKFLHRSASALGIAIGNAANLINPERFILGGGVTKSGDRYWKQIRETARQTALPEVKFDVVPAELGDDAPLWGAVALTGSLR